MVDAKNENLEEVFSAFKRRFGDFQSSAKASCERDKQKKVRDFLDVLQKTANEAFGPKAKKFNIKAIHANMPVYVKKNLNRAYLEDKPCNSIVLHLEREMCLNGLGAPDQTTLVPLNSVDVAPTKTKKEPNQRGNCFHCGKNGHCKVQCRNLRKDRYYETKEQNGVPNTNEPPKPKCDTCGKTHETEKCWNDANAANDPRKNRREFAIPTSQISGKPIPTTKIQPETNRGNSNREETPNRYDEHVVTECSEGPTQDWKQPWNVGIIFRNNARNPSDPKPLLEWVTESPENYPTLKRPLPETKTDRINVYDMDYRCNP